MALVSSLGVDGEQVIAAGTTADVKFTVEYTDKHKLHGENGLSVVIASAAYWVVADALVELDGLGPGATIDLSWARVKDDGTFINDAWRLTFTADENGRVRDQLGGQFSVDASNRLRLRVYNTAGTAVTVRDCLAKASLLKYRLPGIRSVARRRRTPAGYGHRSVRTRPAAGGRSWRPDLPLARPDQ